MALAYVSRSFCSNPSRSSRHRRRRVMRDPYLCDASLKHRARSSNFPGGGARALRSRLYCGPTKNGRKHQMAATNINVVVITGNLTRDPELRNTPSGTPVCSLRVACNTRRKDQSGEWVDKPNYFDVTVWGAQGENCATYLQKGRPVAIDGRLEWREWQDGQGNKRQAVDIIADSVQFLGSRDGSENGGGRFSAQSDVPTDTGDFEPAGVGSSSDDIPF